MYSAYKLNKQGDNIQPSCTLFPNLNQSVVSGPVLFLLACIQVSQETGKVVDIPISKNFPQFVVIHIVKGFSIVNEAEGDVFLEFLCYFNNLRDVGNLSAGSSAFAKPSCTSGSSWFT